MEATLTESIKNKRDKIPINMRDLIILRAIPSLSRNVSFPPLSELPLPPHACTPFGTCQNRPRPREVFHLTQVNNFLTKYKHSIKSLACQENQKGIFLAKIPQRGILVKCILDKFSIIFAKEQKNGTRTRSGCQVIDPVCKMVLNPAEAPASFILARQGLLFLPP